MKKLLILLLLALPAFGQKTLPDGIQDLATQITTGLSKQNKQRVGITALTDLQGGQTTLGKYLAEAITTKLVNSGVDVVERTQMDKLIAALKIEDSGTIDPATAKKVGTQAGVEAFVIGNTTDMKFAISVIARVIDAQSGKIIAAAQTLITRDPVVAGMLDGAKPVVEKNDKGAPPQKAVVQEEDDGNSWIMSGTRVVVDGGERSGDWINLALAFENDSEEERTVKMRQYHLIDEHGDRYNYSSDTQEFMRNGVNIPAQTRVRSTFHFHCRGGDCNGKKFKIFDANNNIVLRNLTVAR